jgi:hypothetical protein
MNPLSQGAGNRMTSNPMLTGETSMPHKSLVGLRSVQQTRQRLAETQKSIFTADQEIEKLQEQRVLYRTQLATAERRARTLSMSPATSELKVKQERELGSTLTELSRLQQLIRISDEEINLKQEIRNRQCPSLEALQRQVQELDEEDKREVLSNALSVAMGKRVEAEITLNNARIEENKRRLDIEILNDAIQQRRTDEQRQQTFIRETERRSQSTPRS